MGDTGKGIDVSICLRCALSDGWPKKLLEAPPHVQEMTCGCLHLAAGDPRDKRPIPRAQCIAGRGMKFFRWSKRDAQGKTHQIFEPGWYVHPWSGSARYCGNVLSNAACSDFTAIPVAVEEGG